MADSPQCVFMGNARWLDWGTRAEPNRCVRFNQLWWWSSFVPLATLSLLGGVDETVMRVFFRCFSEGDAHGLATLLTVAFSIMQIPSFLYFSRMLKGVHGMGLICTIAVLAFASGLWMFDCAVVVYTTLYLMLLSAFIRDIRGLVCIVACGLMIVVMGEYSHSTSQYLVVKCLRPKCQGWVYGSWVLGLCSACVHLWRHSMNGNDKKMRNRKKTINLNAKPLLTETRRLWRGKSAEIDPLFPKILEKGEDEPRDYSW